ncbi:MAG: SGNH/GDSL hydrolase family protein [Bacteroidales bacterium]
MKNTFRSLLLLFVWILSGGILMAQAGSELNWWDPATGEIRVIEGQGWGTGLESSYDRLPLNAREAVRPAVWHLSHHSAGVIIRFRCNAPRIVVRYQVEGALDMPHMPSTGVSGVDLYAKSPDGQWLWATGRYSFGDTIRYDFNGIDPGPDYVRQGLEYHLYLPLYNRVKWLQVGIPDSSFITPLPIRTGKPIVAYGTSIMQGACASRPGMAWTAILGRKLNFPMINLGFSGNGRLEPALIERMSRLDASVYILDCLPNLSNPDVYSRQKVVELTLAAVRQLRATRPDTPILLVDHAGYTDGAIIPERRRSYLEANEANLQAYNLLIKEGTTNLYLLTRDEINLCRDAMVDGTHPTDLGMMEYATAYEKMLRKILH